jgi:hypothetical protein
MIARRVHLPVGIRPIFLRFAGFFPEQRYPMSGAGRNTLGKRDSD